MENKKRFFIYTFIFIVICSLIGIVSLNNFRKKYDLQSFLFLEKIERLEYYESYYNKLKDVNERLKKQESEYDLFVHELLEYIELNFKGILKGFNFRTNSKYSYFNLISSKYRNNIYLRKLIIRILKSEHASEIVYEYLKKTILDQWYKLNYHQRSHIYDALLHSREYLTKENLKLEEEYYSFLSNKDPFITFSHKDYYNKNYNENLPYSITSAFRDYEVFAYRRYLEGADVDVMKMLVEKLLSDLKFPQNGEFTNNGKQFKEKVHFLDGKRTGKWEYYSVRNNDNTFLFKDISEYKDNYRSGIWIEAGEYSIIKYYYKENVLEKIELLRPRKNETEFFLVNEIIINKKTLKERSYDYSKNKFNEVSYNLKKDLLIKYHR